MYATDSTTERLRNWTDSEHYLLCNWADATDTETATATLYTLIPESRLLTYKLYWSDITLNTT